MLSLLLLACASVPTSPCSADTGATAQSLCQKAQFSEHPPENAAGARTLAAQMKDPLTREVVIEDWLKSHPAVTPEETRVLCELLAPASRAACERHGTAAPLRH